MPSFKLISQNMSKKSLENFSLAGSSINTPPSSDLVRQRAKNCPIMKKISRDQDTHNVSVCTKSEASIWFLRPWMQINDFDLFLAVKSRSKCSDWYETRTWPVTPSTACIYQVSNRYLKTCRKKARKTLKNPKCAKIIAKILKIIFLQKTELMSRSIQQSTYVPNFKNLSWFMRPWLQKMCLTYFGL